MRGLGGGETHHGMLSEAELRKKHRESNGTLARKLMLHPEALGSRSLPAIDWG